MTSGARLALLAPSPPPFARVACLGALEVACSGALYTFGDRTAWAAALLYGLQCLAAIALMLEMWTRDDRAALIVIAIVATAIRLPALASAPHLSNDAYRYIWDGQLVLHGIDPHAITPLSPAARFLQTTWLWPHIDYRSIPTIYPPLALALFAIGALDGHDLWGMKLVSVTGDFAVAVALLVALQAQGIPRGRVAIYALHPLAALEFAGNAHIESWSIAGMAFAAGGPPGRLIAARAVALAGAVLTKIYPIAIAPIVFARNRAAFLGTLAIIALMYVPSALHGNAVGSAANYVASQRFNGSIGAVFGTGGEILSVAIVGSICFLRVRGGGDVAPAALATVLAFLISATNVLPWYVLALPAMMCVVGNPFEGPWRAASLGILAWSFSVAIAYGAPTIWDEGRPLGLAMRVVEYAPLYVGLLISALGMRRTTARVIA